jgi:O-acetyl-ADP-ribose deacetylase (regulator of RNase III)
MIVYRQGDVVQAFENGEVDVLIHQCNAQGVMGSGIARQIKERLRSAYEAYRSQYEENGNKLYLADVVGAVGFKRANQRKHGTVLNVVGQDKYVDRTKCNTNYAALGKGLLSCLEWIEKDDVIAMPKIGAGLGGGDWRIIEALIESAFEGYTVYVYTLEEPKKYSKRNDIA